MRSAYALVAPTALGLAALGSAAEGIDAWLDLVRAAHSPILVHHAAGFPVHVVVMLLAAVIAGALAVAVRLGQTWAAALGVPAALGVVALETMRMTVSHQAWGYVPRLSAVAAALWVAAALTCTVAVVALARRRGPS